MIRRLLYLNGLATISAVLFHATGWGYTAMFWWTDRYRPVTVPNFDQLGGMTYFSIRAIEQLVIVAIPAFLFVSGFFIAFATGRTKRTIGWNVVGTRIKNLAIPYVVWSIIVFVMLFALGEKFSLAQMAKMLVFGETQPPYYYVPLVIQLYLLAPLLVPWAKNHWVSLLVVAAIIQFAVLGIRYATSLRIDASLLAGIEWLGRSWFFPGHIFWFSAGLVVSFHLKAIKTWAEKYRWWLLGFTVVAFIAGMIEWEMLFRLSGQQWIASEETVIDGIYSIFFMLTFIAFDQMALPAAKQIADIGTKSFGIYLIHAPVLMLTARVLYHFTPWLLAYQILFLPVLVIAGIAVPMILMIVVKQSPVHRYYQFIFG